MKYLMGLCQLKKDFYDTLMYRVEIDAMFRNIMANTMLRKLSWD